MEQFNVGEVVRDWSVFMLGSTPNRVQPFIWAAGLEILEELTDRLVDANTKRGAPPDQLSSDLARWLVRLDEYYWRVSEVGDLYDRFETLWTVTAPLLLGWYGGPDGTDPLPEGGYRPGFDPQERQLADIGTPYRLASQLGVAEAFERDRPSYRKEMQGVIIGFGEGVGQAAINAVTGVGSAVLRGASAAASTAAGKIPWYVWALGIGLGAWWLLKPAAGAATVAVAVPPV